MKRHIPIMVSEILSFIPEDAQLIVDGTFGHGGHSIEFVKWLKSGNAEKLKSGTVQLIGMERDPRVLEHGKQYLAEKLNGGTAEELQQPVTHNPQPVTLINDSYVNIKKCLPTGQKANFVLLDLGINREHVTDNIRGFSIQGEGPLDMRFTPEAGKTAYELIKSSTLDEIKGWFMTYADFTDKRATAIATIISNNKSNPKLNSTLGLIEILKEIKIHTKELAPLFQAIRIATNREFENIDAFIASLDDILAPGGRCAIMTFHSIEDRIIKYHFKALADTEHYTILTKHVISPHYMEVKRNKASRSAKLRVIERV